MVFYKYNILPRIVYLFLLYVMAQKAFIRFGNA